MIRAPSHPSVLIAEDEAIVALDLRRQLEAHGFDVVAVVGRSDEVLPTVQTRAPSVVLMDVRLRGPVDGVTLADEIFVCEDTPVVFLSAFSDRDIISRAARSGAYGYLTKPVAMAALVSTLEMAIHKHRELVHRRQSSEWLVNAMDAVEFGVVGLDDQGSVKFMNRAARAITGQSLLEARGGSAWVKALDTLPPRVVDAELTAEFGSAAQMAVRATRYPLADGGCICLLRLN